MSAAERAATAQVAAQVVVALNGAVRDIATATRTGVRSSLKPLGPAGTGPVDAVEMSHNAIATVIDAAAHGVGYVAGQILAAKTAPDAPAWDDRPDRFTHLAAVRAAFGDRLPEALAPPMRIVPVADLRTNSLMIFAHGLGGHEEQWSPTYLDAATGAGFTPVALRYNTGHGLARNAGEFSAALSQLIDDWPTRVERIVLVGHSMGGLILTLAVTSDSDWSDLVTDVVTLGTPFAGAPLERVSREALRFLGSRASVRPLVTLGNGRSLGVKDLGDGIPAAVPEHIRHNAVVASLGGSVNHPKSRLLGDGIVPTSSAGHHSGPHVTTTYLPNVNHMALMRSPAVEELLARVAALD